MVGNLHASKDTYADLSESDAKSIQRSSLPCFQSVVRIICANLDKGCGFRYEFAMDKMDATETVRKAMLKIFKGTLTKAFNRWASYAEERQSLMEAMRKVAGSWLMMELGMAFRKWLAWWDDMCEQRDLVRKVMGRIKNSQMFGLWNFWREVMHCAPT